MAAADLNTIRATIEQLLSIEFIGYSLFDAILSLDAIVSLDNPNDPGLAIEFNSFFDPIPSLDVIVSLDDPNDPGLAIVGFGLIESTITFSSAVTICEPVVSSRIK